MIRIACILLLWREICWRQKMYWGKKWQQHEDEVVPCQSSKPLNTETWKYKAFTAYYTCVNLSLSKWLPVRCQMKDSFGSMHDTMWYIQLCIMLLTVTTYMSDNTIQHTMLDERVWKLLLKYFITDLQNTVLGCVTIIYIWYMQGVSKTVSP